MSQRVRNWIVIAITVLLAAALSLLARAADWGDVTLYTVGAGLLAVIVLVGLPWVELPRGQYLRYWRMRD